MLIKRIERLARHKHALLLGMASLALCTSLSGLAPAKAANSPTQVAQHTNLYKVLNNHPIKSSQFSDLLIHNFQINSDSDIAHGKSALFPANGANKPNRDNTFRLHKNVVQAKAHTCAIFNWKIGSMHYSDISDASDNDSHQSSALITYCLLPHHLYLQEINPELDQTKDALRNVDYKLDKVYPTDYGKQLVFEPQYYATKSKGLTHISQRAQGKYPLRLAVIDKSKINHNFPLSK